MRAPPRVPLLSNAITLPLFALRSHHCCHTTTMGAAIAIDEYVPIKIPTVRAKENPRKTSPPKKNKHNTVTKVSPEVKIVLLKVWLMERLAITASDSRRFDLI